MLVGFIPQIALDEVPQRQVGSNGQPEARYGEHHAIERLLFAGCDRIYVALHPTQAVAMERHNSGKDYLLPIAYLYTPIEAGLANRLDAVYPFAQEEGTNVVVIFPGHDLSARSVVECRRMFEAHGADYVTSRNIIFYKMNTFGQYLRDQISRGKGDIDQVIESASRLGMRIRTFRPPIMRPDPRSNEIDQMLIPLKVARFAKTDREMRAG